MSRQLREITPAMHPCRRCGHERVVEERCQAGPHYGRYLCERCCNFCGWIPKPRSSDPFPPSEILEAARKNRRSLARLEGVSESQTHFAASVRSAMIRHAAQLHDDDRVAVLCAIKDSSWY